MPVILRRAVLMFFMVLSPAVLAQSPDCSQVTDKLRTFTQRVNENNYAVTSFVGEVSVAVDTWYSDYSQMEDQTVAIAPDFFSPLRDASDEIGETVNVAYEQMDILDLEGQDLIAEVEACMAKIPANNSRVP